LQNCTDKYVLFCEDDWIFENNYDWIGKSVEILESNQSIMKVLARDGSPHPCKITENGFGYIGIWVGPDEVVWCGFSWNPGVTRAQDLKNFIPFPKWEQELAKLIYFTGYQMVELEQKVYKHIGDGRSTH
jgi:hypothetical protein